MDNLMLKVHKGSYAMKYAKRKGINIEPDYISCVNLGKVTDFTDGMGNYKADFNTELSDEQVEFAKIEQKLYDKITTNISELRLKRCLERTAQLNENLVALLAEKTKGFRERKDDLDRYTQYLSKIEQELGITDAELNDIVSATSSQAPVSAFDSEIDSRINSSENMSQCLERLERLADRYFSDVNTFLSENLYQRYKTKVAEYVDRMQKLINTEIKEPTFDRVSVAIEERLTREELRQYIKKNSWWQKMLGIPLTVDVVRDAVRKMKKDLTSYNTLKGLIKDEVFAMETIYIKQLNDMFEAAKDSFITEEELNSLETLEQLRSRLSNIIM
jgi:hypothetical protein